MSAVLGGRIPESFIQSVVAKTDIVSLIQESIKLRKAGANYSACCPFHSEKTPSFTVNQAKQFYHCFGCGAHGDAIRFLMEHQSYSFVEAVERLATRLGMSVPKDPKEVIKKQVRTQATSVLNQVAEFYHRQFTQNPHAQTAVTYLKKRGISGKIAKAYCLGFAPPGWDNLLKSFQGQNEGLKIIEENGLIIKHPEGRYYDRFRERIMFPIRGRRGEVIGFGGRVLDHSQPKYLNSPETPLFQKGHCLYGIYETLQTKEKWQTAIVVEGYFDVVMLAQFGIMGAVATLGTAVTSHHLTHLFQFVSEVVFCFDGDKAGQAAAWKALQLVLPLLSEGRQVRFAFLPEGEDPDSFVRNHGAERFRSLIQTSTPLSEYFFATLCEKVPLDSVDNRAHLASLARPMLEEMPQGIFKEMMYERLAQLAMSSTSVVRGEKAPRFTNNPYWQKKKPIEVQPPPPQPVAPAFIASAILLAQPTLYAAIKNHGVLGKEIITPGMDLLQSMLTLLSAEATLSTQVLYARLTAQGFTEQQLHTCQKKIDSLPTEGWEAELLGAIGRLLVIGQQQRTEKLLLKAKNTGLSLEEKQQLKEILQFRESKS